MPLKAATLIHVFIRSLATDWGLSRFLNVYKNLKIELGFLWNLCVYNPLSWYKALSWLHSATKPVILGFLFGHQINITAVEIKLIEQCTDHKLKIHMPRQQDMTNPKCGSLSYHLVSYIWMLYSRSLWKLQTQEILNGRLMNRGYRCT